MPCKPIGIGPRNRRSRLICGLWIAGWLTASLISSAARGQQVEIGPKGRGISRDHRAARAGTESSKPVINGAAPVREAPLSVLTVGDWLPVTPADDPTVIRQRSVELAGPALVRIAQDRKSPQTISMPLFDGRRVVIDVNLIEWTSDARWAMFGELVAPDFGWFTLVFRDGIVAANLRSPALGVYQIRYLPSGAYVLRQIDESKFLPCGTVPADDFLVPPPLTEPIANTAGACADDGSQIDMLVVYTQNARVFAGGTSAIQTLINLAEAETNSAYLFSQISPRVRVVATHEVNYQESGNSQIDREHLYLPNDGVMDEVHLLRDEYVADVVSLIVHNLEVCGRAAFSVQAGSTPFPQLAFNVVKDTCATGNFSFGHELGHNQGCRHDRGADNSDLGAFPYAHGYRDPSNEFRTIMAVLVQGVPRIPLFSNSDLTFNFLPLGVPPGEPDSADNSLAINNTAPVVANFRNRDCNGNGVCDEDDIANGQSQDCNHNGRPDSCELDCNHNGRHDQCDIAMGTSQDCAHNGIPDECEPDCNQNGIVDTCDILSGQATDNNHNQIPDTCEPPIIYVDINAKGLNTGTSWINASRDLQAALATAAVSQGAVHEIWVAAGTYTSTGPEGSREATFNLISGVGIYGGFVGGETSRTQRNPEMYETILSGDLNSDDTPSFGNRSENSYNVVTSTDTLSTAVLDGFVIRGGHADASFPHNGGAGLFNSGGSPRISRCVFRDHDAGGPTILGHSGAVNNHGGSPFFVDCLFVGNVASGSGGAVGNNLESAPTFINCRFFGNSSPSGGAVRNGGVIGATPMFINCVFSGNQTSGRGAAVINFPGVTSTFHNCTIAFNSALQDAGGVFGEAESTVTITNSILWGNSGQSGQSQSAQLLGGDITIHSSCVQNLTGSLGGMGNSSANPMFGAPAGHDSAIGTADDQFAMHQGSPCIDSGTNNLMPLDMFDIDSDGSTSERIPLDVLRKPRFFDQPDTPNGSPGSSPLVDRGAYENVDDCNGNGISDPVETASGASQDCNQNSRPDECEPFVDCNHNAVRDSCDISTGFDTDCNANAIPDECDLASAPVIDCNANSRIDSCDIADGTSDDCNDNAVPDECDFADGTSKDCNDNDIPDDCESMADCDHNGELDICQIDAKPRLDCDLNGILDKCESQQDCNNNLELDFCELARGDAFDCDGNGLLDQCDIESGAMLDVNVNKIPDPCEFPTLSMSAVGCRYLSIVPVPNTHQLAIRIRGDASDSRVSCVDAYVQANGSLGPNAVFLLPAVWASMYVSDSEIIPSAIYRTYADYGDVGSPELSLPVSARTWAWGDFDNSGDLDLDDLSCMLNASSGNFNLCAWYEADMMGFVPNHVIDISDLTAFLTAFAGGSYPGPSPCP